VFSIFFIVFLFLEVSKSIFKVQVQEHRGRGAQREGLNKYAFCSAPPKKKEDLFETPLPKHARVVPVAATAALRSTFATKNDGDFGQKQNMEKTEPEHFSNRNEKQDAPASQPASTPPHG